MNSKFRTMYDFNNKTFILLENSDKGKVSASTKFKYQQEGFDGEGRVKGHFTATGSVPEFYEEMRQRGLNPDMSIFQL